MTLDAALIDRPIEDPVSDVLKCSSRCRHRDFRPARLGDHGDLPDGTPAA